MSELDIFDIWKEIAKESPILKEWKTSFCKSCGKHLDEYGDHCEVCSRNVKIDQILDIE